MKIGILGTRGIPNNYGGFEQFAQHLSIGLTERGHEVFVYNSSLHPYMEKYWEGINIIHCNDWEDRLGTAGQFIYDLNCIKDARTRGFDVLLQLGYTSNSIWFGSWPKNPSNVVNMDGLEWKRAKYSKLTRLFLKKAEAWAAKHADWLIADSIAIQQHILDRYNRQSTYIPYAAEIFSDPNALVPGNFHVQPQQYHLLIARMEPENNIEMIIQGYHDSAQNQPLLIVGSVKNKFGKRWSKKYSSERIRFIDAIYDKNTLDNLRFFSSLYFHGHSVGGTNPSLLEAMACQCNIAAHDNPFNKAVLGDAASYFSTTADVKNIVDRPIAPSDRSSRTVNNLEKIATIYTWERIIDSYDKLFTEVVRSKTKLTYF